MYPEITTGLFALAGALVGGLISFWHQEKRIAADIAIAIEATKTEHMAEKTALGYLNHKGYTDRSFDFLSKRLGGFENDELRKILVRAGAVRYIRGDGKEYWRLLSRSEEANNKKTQKENLGAGNEDL